MNRRTCLFLTLSCLGFTAQQGLAQVTEQSVLRSLFSQDVKISSWSTEESLDGEVGIQSLRMEGDRKGSIEFRNIIVSGHPDAPVFSGQGLIWTAPSGGQIRAFDVQGSDLSLLRWLMHTPVEGDPTCGGFARPSPSPDDLLSDPEGSGSQVRIRARGVDFIADPDLLPYGTAPERLTVAGLEMDLSAGEDGCPVVDRIGITGLRQESDGFLLMAGQAGFNRVTGDVPGMEVDIEDAIVTDPEGGVIVRAEGIGVSAATSYDLFSRTEGVSFRGALLEYLMETGIPDMDLDFFVRGLSMPVRMSEEARLSIPGAGDLKLPDDYRISGDFNISAVSRGNRVRLVLDQDLDGLFLASGEITFEPNGKATQLTGLMSGDRMRGFLASLTLVGARLEVADRGIDSLVRLNTGAGIAGSLAAESDRILSRAPGRLRETAASALDAVVNWIGRGVAGRAEVTLDPGRPVTAVEFGTMFALNPKTGLNMLNISSE